MNTIGGLRAALSVLDPTAFVFIDGRPPTALSSYRGFYDQLAIERAEGVRHERTELDGRDEPFEMNMAGYGTYHPGNGEVRIKADTRVGDLVAALDLAVGEVFEGYKGGQYTMRSDTEIWVSEYGRCESLQIAWIELLPGSVNLVTNEVSW